MLRVTVRFVDGSVQEWAAEDELYDRYQRLVESGYTGRDLVHELFTDDWGPPPLNILITGTTAGEVVDLNLDYPRDKAPRRR